MAEPWFRRTPVGLGVTRIDEPWVHPLLAANAWLVEGSERDLLVDAGLGVAPLRGGSSDAFGREPLVVLTHAHSDHVGSAGEFSERWIHELEVPRLSEPTPDTLTTRELPADLLDAARALGAPLPDLLIEAKPWAGFDPEAWEPSGATASRTLREGDVVDLGDRQLSVLHLPGHSPGGIGLYEERNGILFSGDVIYDGLLLDQIDGADLLDYAASVRRLRALAPAVVHPGHGSSFDRERLTYLCDRYLAHRADLPR